MSRYSGYRGVSPHFVVCDCPRRRNIRVKRPDHEGFTSKLSVDSRHYIWWRSAIGARLRNGGETIGIFPAAGLKVISLRGRLKD